MTIPIVETEKFTGTDGDNEQLIADFEVDGFLVHDFGFDPTLIDECAEVTASLIGRYGRVQDLWRRHICVRQLGAHPKVLSLLKDFYRRRAFPFQTLNFTKGTQQSIHSDTIFFNSEPAHFMCGVWVALEDIDMENGPLQYFAGSHKLPIATPDMIEKSEKGGMNAYFSSAAKNYAQQCGVMKKGQAIIWAANVLHGGSPIKDKSRTRLSQVTHYYFDNCVYTTPVLENTKSGASLVRYPYDFSANRFVFGRRNGRIVWPSLRSVISGPVNNLIRRTPSWKE